MDVVDFIVNLYNVRSVRICAKSVGILFLKFGINATPNELKFAMSVPVWLLCNTASFLPQILAGKVFLKNFYHHDSLKCVLIFITISFL